MPLDSFYGPDQAWIHDDTFGDLADHAAGLLLDRLHASGLARGRVVDLGCGSGILARRVSDAGYEVLGYDLSPAMVELARGRAPDATIRCASLLDVELPPVVAVTAIGEALNYATDPRVGLELLRALCGRVHRALEPGGLFLFDVATAGRAGPAGHRQVWHDHDQWSMFVDVREDARATMLERRITIFRRTHGGGSYRRVDEHHVLRLYDPVVVHDVLTECGFTVERRDDYGSPSSSVPPGGWAVFVATRER